VTGLRVAGSSVALRPLALAEGYSKGSGHLGARSGNVATRHPQADSGHDPEPLDDPTLKTHRFPGNRKCDSTADWDILSRSGPILLAFAPGEFELNTRGYFYF